MSDTPPKPKPGSLKDRIAAFEAQKKADAGGAGPKPPPVGAKPPVVRREWKATHTPEVAEEKEDKETARGGMSASDAKESIKGSVGGSLKERMAALQGKGAFGAPAPVPPPLAPKPKKWEIPSALEAAESAAPAPAPAPVTRKESDPKEEAATEGAEDKQPNEEDEEAERRRAIAARMARLGGARIGLGPPIYGKKPVVRRPSEDAAAEAKPEPGPASPEPKEEHTPTSAAKPAEEDSEGRHTFIFQTRNLHSQQLCPPFQLHFLPPLQWTHPNHPQRSHHPPNPLSWLDLNALRHLGRKDRPQRLPLRRRILARQKPPLKRHQWIQQRLNSLHLEFRLRMTWKFQRSKRSRNQV